MNSNDELRKLLDKLLSVFNKETLQEPQECDSCDRPGPSCCEKSEEVCCDRPGPSCCDGVPDLAHMKEGGPLEGFIIFYVNVGQMPPANAEKYLLRVKKSYDKILCRIPSNLAVLWIPRRSDMPTTVEIARFQ